MVKDNVVLRYVTVNRITNSGKAEIRVEGGRGDARTSNKRVNVQHM